MKNKKYSKEEFDDLKHDLMVMQHQIIIRAEKVRAKLSKVISALKELGSPTKDWEITLDCKYLELLEDYDYSFFKTLPSNVSFGDSTIAFFYNDYDDFGGIFTIKFTFPKIYLSQQASIKFYSINDLVNFLENKS